MACLKIIRLAENAAPICIVHGVRMPDGKKRDYVECGANALSDIFCRIRADKAFIRAKAARQARQ